MKSSKLKLIPIKYLVYLILLFSFQFIYCQQIIFYNNSNIHCDDKLNKSLENYLSIFCKSQFNLRSELFRLMDDKNKSKNISIDLYLLDCCNINLKTMEDKYYSLKFADTILINFILNKYPKYNGFKIELVVYIKKEVFTLYLELGNKEELWGIHYFNDKKRKSKVMHSPHHTDDSE